MTLLKKIGDRKEGKLAVVHLMTEDQHHHGLSLRKALAYTDCSRNTYYYNKKRPRNTRRQCQLDRAVLEKKIEEIILQRPSYGTRRMAAMLTRVLGKSINRKRIQKIYRKLNLTMPSRKKEKLYARNIRTSKRSTDQMIYGKLI